jgi:DNA-binding LacI/PurR family transcriptional regulator
VEEHPGIIGMIVPSLSDPLVIGITPYIQKAFSSIGIGFSIITKDPDDQRFNRMIGAFKKFFSGLIIVGEAADDYTIRLLRTSDYPFILLENSCKSLKLNTVCSDSCSGAKQVADHIRKLGYRNLIITIDRQTNKSNKPLLNDFEFELSRDNSGAKPVIAELEPLSGENEYDFGKFETFLRPPFRADAIITMNAAHVYPVLSLLRKKKLRIPQDIALMSMEEGVGFNIVSPPVTCLRKPLPGMAIKTANMMWSEIKNSGKGKFRRQINLNPELVIRDSCGQRS